MTEPVVSRSPVVGNCPDDAARATVRVSVIIPNYNYEKTLGACLRAAFAQTHPPFEVIVVDDGSTDRSVEIARGFPCRLIESPVNGGASAARNLGAAASRGDILFFLDSDVALAPDALANTVEIFAADPSCGCVHGIYDTTPLYDDGPVEVYRILHNHYWRKRSLGRVPVAVFALGALRREVFERVGDFEVKVRGMEDVEYSSRLAAQAGIVLTDRVVGYHDDEDRLPRLLRKQFRYSQMLVPLAAAEPRGGGLRSSRLTDVVAATLTVATIPLGLLSPWLLAVPALFFLLFAVADPGLSRFVLRERGPRFLFFFTAVHFLVRLALAVGAAVGALRWVVDGNFGPDGIRAGRLRNLLRMLLIAVLLLAVLAGIAAAAHDAGGSVLAAMTRPRAVPAALAALLANLGGLLLALAGWRVLLLDGLGTAENGGPGADRATRVGPAAAARIYFIGLFGKFLPGPAWGLLAHVRLGSDLGLSSARMVRAYVLSLPVGVVSAAAVSLLIAPVAFGGSAPLLALPAMVALVCLLWPDRVVAVSARLARRFGRPPGRVLASNRAIRRSMALSVLGWLVSGVHLWVLALLFGAPALRALPACVGGFALAAVAGMVVTVLPDGWGAREAVLTVALTSVLPLPVAGATALASRLICVLSDVAGAAGAVLLARRGHRAAPVEPRTAWEGLRING